MPDSTIIIAIAIFFARIIDVSLGTLRQVLIYRGRKAFAFTVAFFESIVWIYAVSEVISKLDSPITALAYAFGFASGTYIGIIIEEFLKIGDQAIRVFSRHGEEIARSLRENGFLATIFEGTGRDGPMKLLFVQLKRRDVAKATAIIRAIDASCCIMLDDVRTTSRGYSHASK